MGSVPGITATEWPKQGMALHQRCEVVFNYGGPCFLGVIVRDDAAPPWRTIIRLDDGRHVLSTECQYRTPPTTEESHGGCVEVVFRADAGPAERALGGAALRVERAWALVLLRAWLERETEQVRQSFTEPSRRDDPERVDQCWAYHDPDGFELARRTRRALAEIGGPLERVEPPRGPPADGERWARCSRCPAPLPGVVVVVGEVLCLACWTAAAPQADATGTP